MIKKLNLKEAESYGWKVNDWQAKEAYEFAIESGYWDEESLNADIVQAISDSELAACLAFIFRMNDFQEWEESGLQESKKPTRKRRISESGRLVNGKVSKLDPQFDSRKSFYNKAQVVTDTDGTQTLYSYNTPVVKIKDGKVELLAMWDSSATTLRHVKEFLQQNGFEVGSKQALAKMYGRANESIRRNRRMGRK